MLYKLNKYIKTRGVVNICITIVEVLLHKNRPRLLKSLYLNLRVLPFIQAIRLPIIIYGKSKILSLMGHCYIEAPIKTGMIKFGSPNKVIIISCDTTYIRINGDVYFKGNASFQSGVEFNVLSGKVNLGKDVLFAERSRLICTNHISIGNITRIAAMTQLMDTNFHYILNLEIRSINKCFGEILIGENCWIGSKSFIQKGTCLPDFSICSSNSLLSKDYRFIPKYSLIAGTPAKLIKTNLVRVWNKDKQVVLHNYFKNNELNDSYVLSGTDRINEFIF